MPEWVSPREAAVGVVGRQSFPATVLPLTESGVGTAPQGYNPQQSVQQQTPAARGVDSESLLNQAIQRKSELQDQRSGITNQRSQLINQLATIPLGKRGHTTPQGLAIQARLKGLDKQEHSLDLQDKFVEFDTAHRLSAAYKNAADTEKFAKDNLTHQTATEAGEVFLKGTEIMGKFKPGTQEFHDEMAKLKEQYPLGFASEAVKGHFGQIAKFHDQEMDRNVKKLSDSLFKVGLTPEQFANATNIVGTNADIGANAEAIKSGQANVGQKGEKAKNIAFEVNGQPFVVGKALFNSLSKTFRPQPKDISRAEITAAPQTEPVGMVSTVRGQPLRPISTAPAGAVSTPQSTAPATPQFQPGHRYKDAQGNEAIYNADGTWMPVTK